VENKLDCVMDVKKVGRCTLAEESVEAEVRWHYPREIFENTGSNLCNLVHFGASGRQKCDGK